MRVIPRIVSEVDNAPRFSFRNALFKCCRPSLFPMSRKRLSKKEKRGILTLHDTGEWKGIELARLFRVSAGRVSQIISDYYNERGRLFADGEIVSE